MDVNQEEFAGSGGITPGRVRSTLVTSSQIKSDQIRSDQLNSGQVSSGQLLPKRSCAYLARSGQVRTAQEKARQKMHDIPSLELVAVKHKQKRHARLTTSQANIAPKIEESKQTDHETCHQPSLSQSVLFPGMTLLPVPDSISMFWMEFCCDMSILFGLRQRVSATKGGTPKQTRVPDQQRDRQTETSASASRWPTPNTTELRRRMTATSAFSSGCDNA